jgi:hypothetical protein
MWMAVTFSLVKTKSKQRASPIAERRAKFVQQLEMLSAIIEAGKFPSYTKFKYKFLDLFNVIRIVFSQVWLTC